MTTSVADILKSQDFRDLSQGMAQEGTLHKHGQILGDVWESFGRGDIAEMVRDAGVNAWRDDAETFVNNIKKAFGEDFPLVSCNPHPVIGGGTAPDGHLAFEINIEEPGWQEKLDRARTLLPLLKNISVRGNDTTTQTIFLPQDVRAFSDYCIAHPELELVQAPMNRLFHRMALRNVCNMPDFHNDCGDRFIESPPSYIFTLGNSEDMRNRCAQTITQLHEHFPCIKHVLLTGCANEHTSCCHLQEVLRDNLAACEENKFTFRFDSRAYLTPELLQRLSHSNSSNPEIQEQTREAARLFTDSLTHLPIQADNLTQLRETFLGNAHPMPNVTAIDIAGGATQRFSDTWNTLPINSLPNLRFIRHWDMLEERGNLAFQAETRLSQEITDEMRAARIARTPSEASTAKTL